jgi:pilus assembly protein CpaF
MFTIIISEKGGAERRETFDKNEINVGRVQGNDLMLPKGNVSKHHARLLFRDGRFIVTDLKSTNGTYVNGRKISQATIVRDGDKIYIGDFVVRLELPGQGAGASDGTSASNDDPHGRTPARLAPLPRNPTPAPPPLAAAPAAGPPPLPMAAMASNPPPVFVVPPRLPADQSVSHFPLERDPDDSESSPEGHAQVHAGAKLPSPPRVPQQDVRARTAPMQPSPGVSLQRATATLAPAPPTAPRSLVPAPFTPGRALPRATPSQAARRLALITLVDRVADVVDLGPLERAPGVDEALSQQIERAVREQAKAMREEGEAPEGTDLELLARDALRELLGLGPIGPLIEDEETVEVHVARPDYVLALKNGQPTLADPSFTSEEALGRVIARLAHQSGESLRDGELVIERRLPRGAHMIAIAPPAASSWVLTVRKRRRVESSLEEMVRSGTMSRSIASFLEACLVARANVLVVGSGGGVVAATLGALASAAPQGERVAVLQHADEVAITQAHVVTLLLSNHGARGEEAVRAACRLGADRLVAASLGGSVAAAMIDAIGEGCEGVLAGVGAPSLRHGLARLASQVALARPGASIEASREAVGESFDVAIEVVRWPDGRQRVVRVAELAGSDARGVVSRDLWVLNADGTGEGAYAATGTVPRLAGDFAARGIKLDGALFKRK